MITADTITDEQIRELRRKARASLAGAKHESRSEVLGLIETCDLALGVSVLQRREDVQAFARARCAEVLEARRAKKAARRGDKSAVEAMKHGARR